jgi:hypothetical protein
MLDDDSTARLDPSRSNAGDGTGGPGKNDSPLAGLPPHLSDQQKDYLIKIVTAEHSALQSARSTAVADANGRGALFLGTVSSSLVALALVAQLSQLGAVFFVFAFVLLPTLFFLGIASFDRVLRSAIEETIYVRGINRIRHMYVEIAPEARDYFVMSIYDDPSGSMRRIVGAGGSQARAWQLFLTLAGMIAVVNSVILGVFAGLLAEEAFGLSLYWCMAVGVVVLILCYLGHQHYQSRAWRHAEDRMPVMFSSRSGEPAFNSPRK